VIVRDRYVLYDTRCLLVIILLTTYADAGVVHGAYVVPPLLILVMNVRHVFSEIEYSQQIAPSKQSCICNIVYQHVKLLPFQYVSCGPSYVTNNNHPEQIPIMFVNKPMCCIHNTLFYYMQVYCNLSYVINYYLHKHPQ
jgi:hypothetical protein